MAGSRERLDAISSGFMESRILITAAELDLFTAVGAGALTAAEIAGRTGTKPAPLERILNALVAMGILAKKEGRFRNTPAARRHLTEDAPEPLRDIIRHRGGMWERWSSLTRIARTGRVPAVKRTKERTRRFIRGMADVAVLSAGETAAALGRELSRARRVLDVGGGPGSYACAFAAKHPGLRVTIFDLPEVLEIARENVAASGFGKRIRLLPGDLLSRSSLGRGYDVALLSNVVHSFKPGDAEGVIRKTARAVRRGGFVAVKEFCLEREGTAPPFAALFSINMLVADAGDSYPLETLEEWMARAGLGRIRRRPLARASTLLVGERIRSPAL